MSLLLQFSEYIRQKQLFTFQDHLVVATSGGVDSAVLCHLCRQAGYSFSIAHCNFLLRDIESERDEEFVKAMAEEYKVPFYGKQFNTKDLAVQRKISIQLAARQLRYEWFDELISEISRTPDKASAADTKNIVLLTAHHANDNVETVLMNFFRGTGMRGLRGILPKNERIIRPLLFAQKQELITYAEENKLNYVEDSSNDEIKYTRNYLRNEIIPSVRNIFPEVEKNITRNIERFEEIDLLYHEAIGIKIKKLTEKKGSEIHIPVLKLLKSEAKSTILYEILKPFAFKASQIPEVISLAQRESGRMVCSATHQILKNRKWLIISPIETLESAHIVIHEADEIILFPVGKLRIEKLSGDKIKIQTEKNIALLDGSKIKFPLLLRRWKQGDYFYPLGMTKPNSDKAGKKKVSRFLIDQKIALNEKTKIWVLESDLRIIWIVGLRIDDRFKVTDATKEAYRISFMAS